MWDIDIQQFTRQCCVSGRSLSAGESYVSALVREGSDVVRRDYAAEAWPGPSPETIGWWRAVVPDPGQRKPHWAPNDVILHYFTQLGDDPAQADIRYVLALFMLRKRLLRLQRETSDAGITTLHVTCPKLEADFEVPVVPLDPQRQQWIQQRLVQLLDGNEDT